MRRSKTSRLLSALLPHDRLLHHRHVQVLLGFWISGKQSLLVDFGAFRHPSQFIGSESWVSEFFALFPATHSFYFHSRFVGCAKQVTPFRACACHPFCCVWVWGPQDTPFRFRRCATSGLFQVYGFPQLSATTDSFQNVSRFSFVGFSETVTPFYGLRFLGNQVTRFRVWGLPRILQDYSFGTVRKFLSP